MNEALMNLLAAVITAAVPILSAAAVYGVKKAAAGAAAKTDSELTQSYIEEIANAVSDAVAATSQTYVDALKKENAFTKEAQQEAAQKALAACIATISPAAQAFVESACGDLTTYLTTKIEAEVRKQKLEYPVTGVLVSAGSST